MPELTIAVRHHRGAFQLDVAFTISRWPALLFGPSGAGKSTLLRILAGLDRPDSGRIVLDTETFTNTQQGLTHEAGSGPIQLVSQRPALFPHLTVRENVAFGIRSLARAERRAAVDELLELLGATPLADRRIIHLSGGERQRVAIARALATRPRLLLLDEAFNGLDGEARRQIKAELSPLLAERKVLALHVTHQIGEAFDISGDVCKMHHGQIVAQGPAREVLAKERDQLLTVLG